ncbi:sulfatase [Aeoliella sp.]|uniref:sulfatase n=1 Tax=Aeoliella sp. TaxID=2795800 RepID=UPI003CCBB8E2
MKWVRAILPLALLLALVAAVSCGRASAASDRPNVLFIAVDDLRPSLGCYGDATANSPAIDALATRGTVFHRAYCQQSLCNPSRASVMTGLRPDTIRVWDLKAHFRDHAPDVVTLPQLFKQHGYHTQSIGKIYHGNGRAAKDPPSWTAEPELDLVRSAKLRYATPQNLSGSGLKRDATERADVPDDAYVDGVVCGKACEALAHLADSEQPFFLAVGFRKPHLPFCAPERYWELTASSVAAALEHRNTPRGAPELATRTWGELEGYRDIPELPSQNLSREEVAQLRHGYYACVAYTDALVGRVIDQLQQSGLQQRTIVVVWGDHGFHLGELGLWTKCSNYEVATRSPLIVYDPRIPTPSAATDTIIELLDIYPTLAELCNLEAPATLEGRSLVPLMSDPTAQRDRVAYSQFPRAASGIRHTNNGDYMGYSVRTDAFRFVEWRDNRTGAVVATELYDHTKDPGETTNVSADAAYAQQSNALSHKLKSVFPTSASTNSED